MGADVPVCEVHELRPKRTRYAFAVVTLNEGERLRNQLQRMKERAELADIVIADGRSTDGSTDLDFLHECGVRTLLITDERGLGTATRLAVAYALDQGYEGLITVDGNGKDGVEALPDFIHHLDGGYDLVQGSRFMKGGFHAHTPLERLLGLKLVMIPWIALGARFWYTDPTNAFRAMSRRFLTDSRVQPLRKVFVRFNMQLYFVYRAGRLGFRVKEIPVRRSYPDDGSVPTKIIGWRHKLRVLTEAILTVLGHYNPP